MARLKMRQSQNAKSKQSTAPNHWIAPTLLVLRALVAGVLVRSCGVLLRATEAVFAARITQITACVAIGAALIAGYFFSTNAINFIATFFAALSIGFDSASLPQATTVCAAVCFALPIPQSIQSDRTTGALTLAVYAIATSVSSLITPQVHVLLPIALLTLAISQHLGTPKRGVRRSEARRQFTRQFVTCGIVLAICVLSLPEVGYLYTTRFNELPKEYSLVEQGHGATGRVSVLDDKARQARFILADHSILGGRYTSAEHSRETVFAQFHVHEAVRMTRTADGKDDSGRGRALCIGLGGGIVAQALHDHGCAVDALELDSAVARFAAAHFGVSGPRVIVTDALKWLKSAPDSAYDYVVHDVFTGGAVPASLYSIDTFRLIRRTLRPDGVLALNFVGAPSGPAVRAVSAVRARLDAVWSHVAMFGEDTNASVVNIVFFASDIPQRLTFREFRIEDALGSNLRAHVLDTFSKLRLDDTQIPRLDIKEATDSTLNAGQWITAKSHWHAMRTILPAKVWYALAAVKHRQRPVSYKRKRRRSRSRR